MISHQFMHAFIKWGTSTGQNYKRKGLGGISTKLVNIHSEIFAKSVCINMRI